MKKRSAILTLIAFILAAAFIACGGGGGGDTPAPAPPAKGYTMNFDSGALLNAVSPLVLTFDTEMDTATLVITGTMLGDSDGGVWTDGANTNDTLTISPTLTWSDGAGDITINVKDMDGKDLGPIVISFTIDATEPTAGIVPPSGDLGKNGSIAITFSETMDIKSLVLGGDLAAEAGTPMWSTDSVTNDRLVITPASVWSYAPDRSLTIDITDPAGNAYSGSLTYTVSAVVPSGDISVVRADNPPTGFVNTYTILFGESMDPDTFVYSLTANYVWSQTTSANDTLTFDAEVDYAVTTACLSYTLSVSNLEGTSTGDIVISVDRPDALIVSKTGRTGGAGTCSDPVDTITEALGIATSGQAVYIAEGTYTESLALKSGVDLIGVDANYDPLPNPGLVVVQGDTRTAVLAEGVTDVMMTGLDVKGYDYSAGTDGKSVYTIRLLSATNIDLININVTGGKAAKGAVGTPGTDASQTAAAQGSVGGAADSWTSMCNDTDKGAGGNGAVASVTGGNGGSGGYGGVMDAQCSGIFVVDGNATSGQTGSKAQWNGTAYGNGGTAGAACGTGGIGEDGKTAHGPGGNAGTNTGKVISNEWEANSGGTGGLGLDGTGGGGGGGSGGCDTGTDSHGAGGGGGGAGGERSGLAGTGGQGGGSSFAVFMVSSAGINLENIDIVRGTGGKGGDGGIGGKGQPGGPGGNGGAADADNDAKAGGKGGKGGDGGSSGGGGGGGGGNAVGVFILNTTPTLSSVTYSGGAAGAGGSGGVSTGINGYNGNSGSLKQTQTCSFSGC